MKNPVSTHRSLALLAVLVTGMISSAFSKELDRGHMIMSVAHILLGIAGAYLLGATRRWQIAAWSLVVLVIMMEGVLLKAESNLPELRVAALFCSMGLLGMLLLVVLKYSLLAEVEVLKLDRILAGVCGYLLIAMIWSNLYGAIEIIAPGSFTDSGSTKITQVDFLYFSLTSLTTLGYGDVLPVSAPGRIFSVLESVFGVLYLAVFISTLVAIPGKKHYS